MSETLTGTCLCGGVELEATDSRGWGTATAAAASIGSDRAWPASSWPRRTSGFAKGEDLVKTYESHLAPRNFCSNCGSSLWDDLGAVNFVSAGLSPTST